MLVTCSCERSAGVLVQWPSRADLSSFGARIAPRFDRSANKAKTTKTEYMLVTCAAQYSNHTGGDTGEIAMSLSTPAARIAPRFDRPANKNTQTNGVMFVTCSCVRSAGVYTQWPKSCRFSQVPKFRELVTLIALQKKKKKKKKKKRRE